MYPEDKTFLMYLLVMFMLLGFCAYEASAHTGTVRVTITTSP